jgi:hypothetical protein
MGERNLLLMSEKLMNHITINSQSVFQSQVRLFPPGFPRAEVEPMLEDYDGLTELIEDLSVRIQAT